MPANLTAVSSPTFAAGKFDNAVDTSNGYFTWANSNYFATTTGTVEWWQKVTSSSGFQIVFGRAGNEWWGMSAGKAATSVPSVGSSTVSVGDGAWHHIAFCFNGSQIQMWVDGATQGTAATMTGTSHWPASGNGSLIHVGRWASSNTGSNPAFPFNGQIDELRFSKIVRYSSAFTPSTSAFSPDSDTLALYHFEADGTDATGAAVSRSAPADTRSQRFRPLLVR